MRTVVWLNFTLNLLIGIAALIGPHWWFGWVDILVATFLLIAVYYLDYRREVANLD